MSFQDTEQMTIGYRKGCLELPFQHCAIRFMTRIMVITHQSQNETKLGCFIVASTDKLLILAGLFHHGR